MSSEEEMNDEDGKRYFVVHRPKWRAKKFQKLVDLVDKTHIKHSSKRAKEQMAERKVGVPSQRSPPKHLNFGYDLFVNKSVV